MFSAIFLKHLCLNSARQNQIDRFTQDLCFLCGQLIQNELFNRREPFTYLKLRRWQAAHHRRDEERVITNVAARFSEDQELIETSEGIQSVIDNMIADAEEVHPLSQFHKDWFAAVVNAKAQELIGNEETQALRVEGLALLSPEQQVALGLLSPDELDDGRDDESEDEVESDNESRDEDESECNAERSQT